MSGGQFDGDGPFAARFGQQPWLRGNMPPWHMWGNVQQIGPITPTFSDSPNPIPSNGQLCRVSYKRPESWHWLFAARIVTAPIMVATNDAAIDIYWDVITGLGRATQQMITFDHFRWTWIHPTRPTPPFEHVMWATSSLTPALDYLGAPSFAADPSTRRVVNQIVAQDIQLNVRVQFFMRGSQVLDAPAVVEVAGFLAPKTHVRPDWLRNDVPDEAQFPGAEVEGR